MGRIELSLEVSAPVERCFDLARSVEAHTRSTSQTGERVVGGRMSGLLELGDEVTWRARHLGVEQELTSRIAVFTRPAHFRDSMVRGAFRSFDHDHFFSVTPAGTLVRDVFEYRMPFGAAGWLADRLVVAAHMRRFLTARLRVLKVMAESEDWRTFLHPVLQNGP